MAQAVVEDRQMPMGYFGSAEKPVEDVDRRAFEIVDEFIAQNPGGRERLIPLLHKVQEYLGYLPFTIQEYVAEKLGMSPVEVYGVVSFYHFFTTVPRGKYQLKVCMGTACFVRHAQRLVETLEDLLKIEVGGVTNDRLFSLEQVRCIGACGLAPAMMVNDDVYGHLTPQEVRKLIRKLKSKAKKEAREVSGE